MAPSAPFVAITGTNGKSTTTALIGDEEGRVLGAGQGGPCNHVGAANGRAKLTRAVEDCVAKACTEAQLDPAQTRYEAACFGMSGGPDDKEALLASARYPRIEFTFTEKEQRIAEAEMDLLVEVGQIPRKAPIATLFAN